ncbi:Synaptotagmin-14 [Fukomys damarensis]|uniref:Synaptotagmin-14 n=1 Tax=Fukomys damarensis TaxID=885580 RepID=A0A091CPW1_FUKDA|nr:Synaptotagmin-14 [Fukomys damarensis]
MLTAVTFFSLVSPEAVGFLSAVGVFIILMLLLFLYINKKFCFENVGGFPDLGSGYDTRKNSQDKMLSSLVDTIGSAVGDLATAVGEAGYAFTDSVAEQVTSLVSGLRAEDGAAAEGAADSSALKDARLPDVSGNTSDQETQPQGGHRAKAVNCYSTPASQKQQRGSGEERLLTHAPDGPQALSELQETANAGDSPVKSRRSNSGIARSKQKPRAGPAGHDLESTDRGKIIGSGIHSNGRNEVKEARYQGMKSNVNTSDGKNIVYEQKKCIATDNPKIESQPVLVVGDEEKMGHFNKNKNLDVGHSDHLKKAEKQITSKGSKGSEMGSGNECSPKGVLTSQRNRLQKSIVKEDVSPAPSANSKEKFPGKTKGQTNPTTSHQVRRDKQTNKNEASVTEKGTAQSKVAKYSKIIPEKDNSYMDRDEHGSSSESEDDALGKYHQALSRTHLSRLPLVDSRQKHYAWETRQKYSPLSAEYDGYSSEASVDGDMMNFKKRIILPTFLKNCPVLRDEAFDKIFL